MINHEFSLDNHYMFGFNYYGKEATEVKVGRPTSINKNDILFHFLHGHKSMAEFVKKQDIVAVWNLTEGDFQAKGSNGFFKILNPELYQKYLESGVIQLKD